MEYRDYSVPLVYVAFVLGVFGLTSCGMASTPNGYTTAQPTAPESPAIATASTVLPLPTSPPTSTPTHSLIESTASPSVDSFVGPVPDGAITRWGMGRPLDIAFSPDGHVFAVASSIGIYVYQVDSRTELWFGSTTMPVRGIAFSPDSRTLASVNGDNIALWDVPTGQQVRQLRDSMQIATCLSFSGDGHILASGYDDGTIILWDVANGTINHRWKGADGEIYKLAFSPDSAILASGAYDSIVQLWDTSKGQPVGSLHGHTDGPVYDVAFSSDGNTLASGAYDGTVILWDTGSKTSRQVVEGTGGAIRSIAFLPSGGVLVFGTDNGQIVALNVSDGKQLNVLQAQENSAYYRLAFSPNGHTLLTSSDAGVSLWDWDAGQQVETLNGYQDFDSAAADMAVRNNELLAWRASGNAVIWDVKSCTQLYVLTEQPSEFGPRLLAISPRDNLLATNTRDGTIRLWNRATGSLALTLMRQREIRTMAFSPDGSILASGSTWHDYPVILWDVNTGQRIRTFGEDGFDVSNMAFSPDGHILATGAAGGSVHLWDVASGSILNRVFVTINYASLAFSPDGKTLAVGTSYGDDGKIILLDVSSGEQIDVLKSQTTTCSLAFAPSGNLLASGAFDGAVMIWDLSTSKLLRTWHGHTQEVRSMAFSSSGDILASGASDSTVVLWDISALE